MFILGLGVKSALYWHAFGNSWPWSVTFVVLGHLLSILYSMLCLVLMSCVYMYIVYVLVGLEWFLHSCNVDVLPSDWHKTKSQSGNKCLCLGSHCHEDNHHHSLQIIGVATLKNKQLQKMFLVVIPAILHKAIIESFSCITVFVCFGSLKTRWFKMFLHWD